ncbi:Phospholipase/carboxylesterase [Meredithblackwellia eburnea MCA 4105]
MAGIRRLLPLVVPPSGKHSATLIFAHGFGATSSDWYMLSELPVIRSHFKCIFPQAPLRPISIARGEQIPAWFDIINTDHRRRKEDGDEDEFGMEESLDTLRELVRKEVEEGGIDRSRVFVGGFSQGAALALLMGIKGAELGGVIALSAYLPLQWKIQKMKAERANSLPVFWAHGTHDQVISYETGVKGCQTMKTAGMKEIEFHTYKGVQHGYCEEELEDLNEWLAKLAPPINPTASKL